MTSLPLSLRAVRRTTALVALALLSTAAPPPVTAEEPKPTVVKVDVNTADVSRLTTVPRIGPVLAGRIVEYRRLHGPFGRVDDLLKVKGIGERLLDGLRPYLEARQPEAPARRTP